MEEPQLLPYATTHSGAEAGLCVLGGSGSGSQSSWVMGQAKPAAYPLATSYSQPAASSQHHQKLHSVFP